MKKALLIILSVLTIDQVSKIYIKTHFYLEEKVPVIGDWFFLHFIENNGMAWGIELGGDWGKLFLSVFRIVFVGAIGWYLYKLIKDKVDSLYITTISLVFAGAIGNIIDSVFYGVLFGESHYGSTGVAQFMPADGGYETFLHGKVVDMLYFPVIEGYFPDWFPFWANEQFVFFRPVFNIADASISIGVGLIILFQKRFFGEKEKPAESAT